MGSQERGVPGRIRKAVQDCITNTRRRRTPPDLEREIAHREACPRPLVRSAIRGLIEQGIIEYRYTFGHSYLALSFRHPVDVSSRFTIVPPGYAREIPSSRIPITIAPGVSFGDGRHPTTRLALQALEMAWDHLLSRKADVYPMVIDIGTGTGVLAIAAACLGAKKVMALDMDACARFEAERNIGFNPKAACVMVMDRSLASIHVRFDLVMANLRLPTLAQLADWMEAHLKPSGCVVVSGCREEEWKPLTTSFAEKGLQSGWQKTLAGWAGGVFLPLCARASDMGTANDTQ